MLKKILFLLTPLLLLCSGCDMFDYHPYDGEIKGAKGINAKNIARIQEQLPEKQALSSQ